MHGGKAFAIVAALCAACGSGSGPSAVVTPLTRDDPGSGRDNPGSGRDVPPGTSPGAAAGGSGEPLPPIDPGTPLVSVSNAELGELCDWWTAQVGGYGKTMSCGGGVTASTYPNHDACVSHPIPQTCTATVGQVEDCVTAIAATGSLCSIVSATPDACKPLFSTCVGSPFS